MAGGVVVYLQAGGGKGRSELGFQALRDHRHYFASQFVGCQFLIGKTSASYFGQ
jgi:hypothetical protein